ncbi:uncharacterized protein V6R79_010062 [Siganus canaliculatus]
MPFYFSRTITGQGRLGALARMSTEKDFFWSASPRTNFTRLPSPTSQRKTDEWISFLCKPCSYHSRRLCLHVLFLPFAVIRRVVFVEESERNISVAFSSWRYSHYFNYMGLKDRRNIEVKCTLCTAAAGQKKLSTACNSNANMLKHLNKVHGTGKLVAKDPTVTASASYSDPGPPPFKQAKLDFKSPQPAISQSQIKIMVARYVVEDMLPISTVESDVFREMIKKIPVKGGHPGPQCRKTFSKYLDTEYSKMEAELKNTFNELDYLSTTADIWTAHNKSFLGVTAHWINPQNMKRGKAALACRRF